MMRPVTFDEVRDAVAQKLASIFPDITVLDLGTHLVARSQDYLQIELPFVSYAIVWRPNFSRVVDSKETKDLNTKTGKVEELIPYDIILHIGCHSELLSEVERMSLRVHQELGRAPVIGGVGFCLEGASFVGSFDLAGVYSYQFRWVGWARLAGVKTVVPLVQAVNWEIHQQIDSTGTMEIERMEDP